MADAAKKRGRPFEKGNTLGGKSHEVEAFRKTCREYGVRALTALDAAMRDGGPTAVAAAKVILEFGFGKPTTPVELSGKDGERLSLRIDLGER